MKSLQMEMRLVDEGRSVSGAACGITSGYLVFTNAPVTVKGQTVEIVVTEQAVIDAIGAAGQTAGSRFIGELAGDTISGQFIPRGQRINITFSRRDSVSGTCSGASRYQVPR